MTSCLAPLDLPSVDVATLLQAAEHGHPGCWEEVVRRYSGLVRATVAQFGLDAAHRADAAQSTWLRLFEKFRTIREPERLGSWLMTTARRECLALIADRKRERATDIAGWDERASTEPTPETDALAADERETLRRAAAELSGRHTQLLDALFGATPSTYAEIASRLGMPIGSIGPTRARIMRRLRRLLQDLDA